MPYLEGDKVDGTRTCEPSGKISRGGWGETATNIDLSKLGDIALVHRAVINGWDVPQHIRDQIGVQLNMAVDFSTARMDEAESSHPQRHLRRVNQFLKLAKLLLAMDARNLIEDG